MTPVMTSQIYVKVLKPPANRGFRGYTYHSTKQPKPGPAHLLWKIYLKHFVESFKNGTKPKKAILFVKRMQDLCDINEFLKEKLGDLSVVKDPQTCPWVLNFSHA